VTVGLRSHSGYFRRTSVVALAIFSQYWYWYPLSYFLTLTLQPTALMGLNSDLQMPKLQVQLASCLISSSLHTCEHIDHIVPLAAAVMSEQFGAECTPPAAGLRYFCCVVYTALSTLDKMYTCKP